MLVHPIDEDAARFYTGSGSSRRRCASSSSSWCSRCEEGRPMTPSTECPEDRADEAEKPIALATSFEVSIN